MVWPTSFLTATTPTSSIVSIFLSLLPFLARDFSSSPGGVGVARTRRQGRRCNLTKEQANVSFLEWPRRAPLPPAGLPVRA